MAALQNPTDIARETLKLLASRRMAPTPENYLRIYHEIAGTQPPRTGDSDSRVLQSLREVNRAFPGVEALNNMLRSLYKADWMQFDAALSQLAGAPVSRDDWSGLIRDLLREMEVRQTGSSLARKKEGLERLLINFGQDAQLHDKLRTLVRSWSEVSGNAGIVASSGELDASVNVRESATSAAGGSLDFSRQLRETFAQTLEMGVAARLDRFPELAAEVGELAQSARNARNAEAWSRLTGQLKQLWFRLEVRGESDAELLDALLRLLGLVVNNIGELVEDDQWVSGQLDLVRRIIDEPLTTERIRAAESSFKSVIYKQSMLKQSLREAKATLKDLISVFVARLSEMTESTAGYHSKMETYAGRIQLANDLGSLKTLVDELMRDTRGMQTDMLRRREEMQEARRQAEETERRMRQLEQELELVSEQVREDQLTGVLNRRGLDEAMARELARAERRKSPLCVAVLDLDNFKKLNDTHGHQAGDEALIHLTKVIKKTLRPTDIVARFGGEEFIVLFGDTPMDAAIDVMRRLQRELTKRFFLHNNERLLITFSAGVAELHPGEDQEGVFGRADKAMYQAKIQGKNRVAAG